MSNPRCVVCGQINRVGGEVCSACDSRLDAATAVAASTETFYATGGEDRREGALPTDIPSPHFQGVGDVVSPTLDVYKKNILLVSLLVLATTLPLAALQLGAFSLADALGKRYADEMIASGRGTPVLMISFMGGLLSYVLMIMMNAFLSGALVYAIIELQRTGTAKAGDCLRWGLRKLPKVFAVSLLYAIITVVGYFLLIVPGVIFSLMFAMAVPVAAAENLGTIDCFKRSQHLTDGYKGLIFLTFFAWGILVSIIGIVIGGSFLLGGAQESSVVPWLLQTLIQEMLNSTTIVLTIFIFLGLLNEARHTFDNRPITPTTDAV